MTKKKWLSYVDVIFIILMSGFLVAMAFAFIIGRNSLRRTSCTDNLKQLALALNLYAKENKDRYPPIDDTKNNFIFDANLLYPEYLNDQMLAMCPADPRWDPDTTFRLTADHPADGTPKGQVHPDCFTGDSYVYLGWMVERDKEVEAFFEAYDKRSAEDYDANITVPEGWGTAEGDTIPRLSAYVDRFPITDMNYIGPIFDGPGIVPIMWDRPYTDTAKFSHKPIGGNVLYLDGHVEYNRMNEGFPPMMSDAFAKLLEERPRDPIPDCE